MEVGVGAVVGDGVRVKEGDGVDVAVGGRVAVPATVADGRGKVAVDVATGDGIAVGTGAVWQAVRRRKINPAKNPSCPDL